MKTPLRFFATTPLLAPLLALLALHGCTSVAGGEEEVAAASKALTVAIGPRAVAYDFATGDALPHGIAGGHRLVFVAEALTGRVAVHGRFSGREIGELPAPPGGFLLPFALRVPEDGTLVVLDAGGFPSLEAPSIPVVYEYRYDIDRGRGFVATLERTVRFAGLPLAFVEDLEVLDDGRYVVSESILGALWVVNTDGSIEPGVFPASPDPADAVPGLNPCALPPGVVVDGIPFEPPGLFAPGVGSLAARDGWLYFGNSCLGGVRRIPIASLSDSTRPPFARGADIEVVTARAADVEFEVLKGLAFNPKADDRRLYAVDSLGLGVIAIDVDTGERTTLVSDSTLFNFPVGAQFLPPILGVAPLMVVSDQEHRLATFNAAIESDRLEPFVVAKVFPLR